MADALDEELSRLRARAYGAHADIGDDPAALARLHELELRARAATTHAAPPLPSPAPGPDGGRTSPSPEPAPHLDTDNSSPAIPATGSDAPSAPASSAAAGWGSTAWRLRGARLIGVAAVAALLTAAVSIPVTLWASGGGDAPYAVLHATDESITADPYFGADSDAVRYEDFLGMQVTIGALEGVQGTCMIIQVGPSIGGYSTNSTQGGCAAPGFEPIVDVTLAEADVGELAREQLGDATGLRFQAVGDEVRVYLATDPAMTPTPAAGDLGPSS